MLATTLVILLTAKLPQDAAQPARDYAAAIAAVNEAHAKDSEAKREEDLAARLPDKTVKQLEQLLAADDAPAVRAALVAAGRAALDLDRLDHFEQVRARLLGFDPAAAAPLGVALSRGRFVAFGEDGVETDGLAAVADAFDLVLDGYADVFGIVNFTKLRGKKLRLRVHQDLRRREHLRGQNRCDEERRRRGEVVHGSPQGNYSASCSNGRAGSAVRSCVLQPVTEA